MNKEYIQALNDLFGLVAFQGSFTKAQKYFDIIEEALKRLEAIDNSNPSEALECLEKVKNYEVENHIKEGWNIILYEEMQEELDTIKQALLKAQEPKHYLKWEDLEFKEEEEIMKVLLNGEMYILKAYKDYILDISIVELEKTDGIFVLYINQCNFQFFNDLHLEKVEE